ncbi:hypothetical protein EUA93_01950 [Nocardioides oleivorans]|uniref:Uncharacterized protein n=1 Tax=Nocardioides oleivorans TaxID=273676 RepID=A0A4V1RKR7_9ACTN|nr:hypothetical protein [Nocardioides oleivorans]RYB93222.1 hypothetical protein EUA93_01950 [Nocardioides oleivorans]
MSIVSTTVRATHLVTNAAWFGGSLMGAVGLNPASREPDTERERVEVSGTGWERWGPVQGAAVALHLVSGLAIVADNRRRVVAHPPTTVAVGLKTALTAAAVASSAAAYVYGTRLGDASGEDGHPRDARAADEARRKVAWLQWTTPALTGSLLVLDAVLGEQQRGTAGLLDRPW